ncbi:P-loop containing nucleoside triphosphate hydrolase protein [Gonapodya prolifera JEL478]|uniref:ATP-dependent DNA helicase n=1 Tax=Gonapodya prolifera (strain JEL478) TaxID=1344416 RepID=A0A139ATW4_GONPJ|nr:P-loop containing nucleoside triphosphate hydrolase protein [Gonapodya prolifera JEL478]|eukprot:KXS20023.1 P-loop containing nucleoside triphosphate hydrolase protein [Gonapodya prolifera JEL478]
MVGGDSGRGSAPTYVVPQSLPKPPDIRPHQHDPDEVLTWIYPTNLPVRAYQLDIVRRSLFQNTLVSLPTGLGKTFIAAVVLSNHLRWFPKSRAVFMVPTKPLVAQQMESVWRSVGMPVSWTVDMTGQMSPPQRALAWRAKRLVFCTPQTFENDLKSSTAPAESFSLLVFDEAHRATGNYSYCEIIKLLYRRNPQFRVLALSATPGSSQQAVQSVITNLLISAAEIRSEAHPDVAPYVQDRKKEIIVTKEDEIVAAVKGLLVKLLDPIIARLTRNKAFHTRSVSESVAPAALLQHRDKTWRPQVKPTLPTAQAHAIEADFGNAISLSHALQNLLQFGVGTCRADLLRWQEETNNSDKYVTKARRDLVNSADFTQLIDNLNSLVAQPGFMGHPKLTKVSQIVREHFTTCGQDSKVIIFSTIRSSVDEIVRSLEDQQPTVRVSVFIGQSGSSGKRDRMTQNEQMKVLEKFQAGDYNVLVATCIGEEGLDIGEVDLIINYDSQSSPIRMTQRIGRTGRKREGRVVMLLQEGKEERAYRDSETRYRNVQRAIENAK